jgi:hypothetical protein
MKLYEGASYALNIQRQTWTTHSNKGYVGGWGPPQSQLSPFLFRDFKMYLSDTKVQFLFEDDANYQFKMRITELSWTQFVWHRRDS